MHKPFHYLPYEAEEGEPSQVFTSALTDYMLNLAIGSFPQKITVRRGAAVILISTSCGSCYCKGESPKLNASCEQAPKDTFRGSR